MSQGRVPEGPNALDKQFLDAGSYAIASDGFPARVVVNPDGSSLAGGYVTTANTPSIISTTTALAANPTRKGWQIQNVGTNPLFILMGTGASTSVFHAVLKGGTGNSDGLGGSISQTAGVVYTGIITIAGTSPLYVVTEL